MPPVFVGVPARIRDIIDGVISREGGFVDDPDDSGGATNMGITFKVFLRWRVLATVEDLKELTPEEATQIYFQEFWLVYMKYYHLNTWLQGFMFDWYVHSGPRNPTRQLQRLVGAKPDGLFGPVSAVMVADYFRSHQDAKLQVFHARARFFFRLIARKPVRAKFGLGWYNRIVALLGENIKVL